MTAYKWRKMLGLGDRRGGFLTRIRRDEKGNTLAIMAAALIPMIGMVGSAVDISRGYLVKTRLQQACDAGVLAARRTMTGQSITNDTNAKNQAKNFFDINLKDGAYGATVTSITVTDVTNGTTPTGAVHGVASADVPTTLMKIFGKAKLTMNVTCEAQLEVSNNDVMFVLDVTGSMNCVATDLACSDNGLVEDPNAKIKALRTEVVKFYDTLAAATTSGSRLRIGFVPYSTTVNVGDLLPAADIADSWTYRSRQRTWSTWNPATSSYGGWTTTTTNAWGSWSNSGSATANVLQATCIGPQPSGSVPPATSVPGTASTARGTTATDANGVKTTPLTDTRTVTDTQYQGVWTKTSGSGSTARGNCQIQRQTRTHDEQRTGTETQTPIYVWTYGYITYDTSQFKLGNAVTTMTGNGFTNVSSSWSGCIEERDTVSNATFPPIPTTAYDLDLDTVPSVAATQWRPSWPEIIWPTSSGNASSWNRNYWACPKPARKLDVMTHQQVYDYVNGSTTSTPVEPVMKAVGFTYHDAGMIWGGRLISPTGLFASENATAPNGKPVNRHIVFMTDGDMKPEETAYSLYGYERTDRRISGASNVPNNTDLKDRHNSRFLAICQAIKDKNITIWVIAYGQTVTTELSTCASPGKAYYAANDTALNTALQNIAQQIAELRLSA